MAKLSSYDELDKTIMLILKEEGPMPFTKLCEQIRRYYPGKIDDGKITYHLKKHLCKEGVVENSPRFLFRCGRRHFSYYQITEKGREIEFKLAQELEHFD